jgi:hypothetical protein
MRLSFLMLLLAKCRAIASYMDKAFVLVSLKALVLILMTLPRVQRRCF